MKIKFPFELVNNFHNSLYKEIEIFKPQLILTYGKAASNLIQKTNLNEKIEILSFAHPTPTANGAWKKILTVYHKDVNIKCTAENKIAYILNGIKESDTYH